MNLLPSEQPKRSAALAWSVAFILAIGATTGYFYYRKHPSKPASTAQGVATPAPVHVATVERKDFPITLTGLGSVQAFNSVTLRTRVDGQIIAISHEEGQPVQQGEVLIQLDPAPYQAALGCSEH